MIADALDIVRRVRREVVLLVGTFVPSVLRFAVGGMQEAWILCGGAWATLHA